MQPDHPPSTPSMRSVSVFCFLVSPQSVHRQVRTRIREVSRPWRPRHVQNGQRRRCLDRRGAEGNRRRRRERLGGHLAKQRRRLCQSHVYVGWQGKMGWFCCCCFLSQKFYYTRELCVRFCLWYLLKVNVRDIGNSMLTVTLGLEPIFPGSVRVEHDLSTLYTHTCRCLIACEHVHLNSYETSYDCSVLEQHGTRRQWWRWWTHGLPRRRDQREIRELRQFQEGVRQRGHDPIRLRMGVVRIAFGATYMQHWASNAGFQMTRQI